MSRGLPIYSPSKLVGLLILPIHRGMARLSWLGWQVYIPRRLNLHKRLPNPVLTLSHFHVLSNSKITPSPNCLIIGHGFWSSNGQMGIPLEYISHTVIPYDHASVFSLYVGFLLLSVSKVSGANHFIGTVVCQTAILAILWGTHCGKCVRMAEQIELVLWTNGLFYTLSSHSWFSFYS